VAASGRSGLVSYIKAVLSFHLTLPHCNGKHISLANTSVLWVAPTTQMSFFPSAGKDGTGWMCECSSIQKMVHEQPVELC